MSHSVFCVYTWYLVVHLTADLPQTRVQAEWYDQSFPGISLQLHYGTVQALCPVAMETVGLFQRGGKNPPRSRLWDVKEMWSDHSSLLCKENTWTLGTWRLRGGEEGTLGGEVMPCLQLMEQATSFTGWKGEKLQRAGLCFWVLSGPVRNPAAGVLLGPLRAQRRSDAGKWSSDV